MRLVVRTYRTVSGLTMSLKKPGNSLAGDLTLRWEVGLTRIR